MATAPTYCTHRQLKDVFPQVDSFDSKRPIYGWAQEIEMDNIAGSAADVWFKWDTGLVTQLFQDGIECEKLTPTVVTKMNGAIARHINTLTVDDTSSITAGSLISINGEYMVAQVIASSTQMVVLRAQFQDQSVALPDDTDVYLVYNDADATQNYKWFHYDSDKDLLFSIFEGTSNNANDVLVEAGEDFSTLITRTLGNASRYLDAKLDPNLPKEQLKDKEGNFDYIIVRTTALIAATFMIRSHDPTSEVANALMEDAQSNIDALNKGGAALSWQTTGDSSKGVIRDITYTSGSIRPVDTRGRWSGDWDLVKVKIITGGVLGTATYSVWVKDADSLKATQVVTARKISGDYQSLAGSLEIRFGGSTDSSVATANNEWEVEVAGWQEEVDNSAVNSVRMTRR